MFPMRYLRNISRHAVTAGTCLFTIVSFPPGFFISCHYCYACYHCQWVSSKTRGEEWDGLDVRLKDVVVFASLDPTWVDWRGVFGWRGRGFALGVWTGMIVGRVV